MVLVWYAGLPFDPEYGVAALKHLKAPSRWPRPDPLDHCAVSVSVYRDGKPAAYALNAFRAADFSTEAEPFAVTVAGNRLRRDDRGYALEVRTPAVDGRTPIVAFFRFDPTSGSVPFERDLGRPGSPHHWILAAADCRVEGLVKIGETTLEFRGRGYHDHNAGDEEISRAIRRWEWGRFHHGPLAEVFYLAEPHLGPSQSLWITCRDGRPETVREGVEATGEAPSRNVFGVKSSHRLLVSSEGASLARENARCVDDGPFYRRWLARFEVGRESGEGISELLDTRHLNRAMFNWMIPYRLKRPRSDRDSVSRDQPNSREEG